MDGADRYDLTRQMAPYFDVHMVGPLLDYLRETGSYDLRTVTAEKIRAVSSTNMVELIEDEYEKMADDPEFSAEYAARRAQLQARKEAVFAQIDHEPEPVQRVGAFFAQEETVAALKASNELTLDSLASQHGISGADLEAYVRAGKFKYECGMYRDAEETLSNYLGVGQPLRGPPVGALWGRLACRIVQANWEGAREDLKALRAAIETKGAPAADQLKQRAWLMHWALFVLLNQRDGMDLLADLLTDKAYMAAVENLCPWMVRYLAVAAVLSPRRRSLIRDALHEISISAYAYSDPVTQLLESLFDNFDFAAAQQRLRDCRVLLRGDFFLCVFADKFVDEARTLLCELYCTINRRVDLSLLGLKLELGEEEAERWMVGVVRNASAGAAVDARIDSAGRQVVMSSPSKSAHQQVAEKTRDLTVRCALLGSNMEALLRDQAVYLQHRHE